MRGGADVEAHLDLMNADASSIGGVILLRDTVSTSKMLEETFHFRQQQRGDYSEYPEKIRLFGGSCGFPSP